MTLTLEEMCDELQKVNRVVVAGHVIPDGDAIGSALALAMILKSIGKDVRVMFDDNIPRNFMMMPTCEKIERPSEKIDVDALVIVDTAPDRIGKVLECVGDVPILNIDHHVSNSGENRKLFCDPHAAATAEIIFEIAIELGIKLTKDFAVCVYVGIATDTGFFQFSNTTAETLLIASDMLALGVKPNLVVEVLEQRPIEVVKGLGQSLNTLEVWHDGKAAGMFLDEDLVANLETTEGFIDEIRVIEGVDVSLLLKFMAKNVCRVSMRSKTVDVSKIAMQFGGGGHLRAAGCTLKMPFEDAKRTIMQAIDDALN